MAEMYLFLILFHVILTKKKFDKYHVEREFQDKSEKFALKLNNKI